MMFYLPFLLLCSMGFATLSFAASNVALHKPVIISTNGANDHYPGEGEYPSDVTDGSLQYIRIGDQQEDGCIGYVNNDYNELMEVEVTIDLQESYDVSLIRYNMGDVRRANTWNADVMTTPFGTTATNPGTSYSGAWTEHSASGTFSQITINFQKTRTAWERDWLCIGEIEVYGEPITQEPAYLSAGDFDKDGDIDGADLAKFSSVFGTSVNRIPVNSPWTWNTLPVGYFCDNWMPNASDPDRVCTAKRPDYSSTSARIAELQDGEDQVESGTIDETFINASASGAFEFTTGEIVISNIFDSKWHDALRENRYFNTVWYPNFPIENFEVISQVDESSAPSSTTNDKSYFFSYNQDMISLTDWLDYLKTITCNFSRKIDTLVIYAHGGYSNNEGLLKITSDILHTDDLQNDNDIRNTLMRLKDIMAPNGHILLFSCNTGQDQDFIKELASLSGAFVHANSNLTGHPDDEAPWFNCASNSECTDWQLDLVCPPSGDCYYE